MARPLTVILDDRDGPFDSVKAALGPVAASDILRRRQTVAAELREIAHAAGATRVVHLRDPREGPRLAQDIREQSAEMLYLRLPLCLPPLRIAGLSALINKAAFALEPALASPVFGDEAVAVLEVAEAQRIMSATNPEERQALFLNLRDRTPGITDHASFLDIRVPQNLMLYLSGATELRHFNLGEAQGGVFRKSSSDVAKMRAEHGFYHAASPEVQRFLLPTFDLWEKGGEAGYGMEYLAVPDAALQWVHLAFDTADLNRLLDRFFDYIDARPPGPSDRQVTRARAGDQIVGKLERRMSDFLQTAVGQKVDALLARAGPQGDLSAMQARALPLIEAALDRNAAASLVFSHGDPCFSNILFDRRIGLMRLIDPRGANALDEALMHPLYDLAKLSHSILGAYDFINNGLFSVRFDPELNLMLDWARPLPDWAGRLFRDRMASAGHDMSQVRAVELSLFLSMLPLHADHPHKLLGFSLMAGQILEELEGGRKR